MQGFKRDLHIFTLYALRSMKEHYIFIDTYKQNYAIHINIGQR